MTASYERGEQSMELNSCCTGDTVNAELLNLGSRLSGGSVTDGMLWPCYLPESHPPRSVLMCCTGTPGNFLKTAPGVPQVCHRSELPHLLTCECFAFILFASLGILDAVPVPSAPMLIFWMLKINFLHFQHMWHDQVSLILATHDIFIILPTRNPTDVFFTHSSKDNVSMGES